MTHDARDQLPKDLSLPQFREFRDYIHQHSGIFLEESKLDSLRISLVTLATRRECASWDRYFDILQSDESEFRELMNLITINETSFFRFPAQFEALRTRVIPEIISESRGEPGSLRFWSAGCSTGEEPYTIAMTYLDSGVETFGWTGTVVGTDVSTKALDVARRAIYPAKALLSLPPEISERHFRPEAGDTFAVAPAPRRICEFNYQNLIKEPYAESFQGDWDVIFCRNVTIYFRLESTRRVVSNFFRSLNEGGYLFIGHSETLSSISDEFEVVEAGGVFLYRKPQVSATRVTGVGSAFAERSAPTGRRDRGLPRERPTLGDLRRERVAERTRTRQAASAAVVEVVEADPAVPQEGSAAQLEHARSEMLAGLSDRALMIVESIIAADPNSADAYLLAAQLHADIGEYDDALGDCTRALAINPLLPGARYILGVIHQREGDPVRAISEFKKTIYIDPDFVLAHMNLGNMHKSQGKYEAATREYENALRALYKNPGGGWTLYLGGWQPELIVSTCERSLLECRKATGAA